MFVSHTGRPFLLAMTLIASPIHAQTTEAHDQLELDQVTVVSSPLDKTALEHAQPVTVLSGEQLDEKKSTTLGETLSEVPGVSSSFFGAAVGRPIIRGLDGARVQVLENGLSSMDASTSSVDHAVSIEPLLADQIEIFRGPSALAFGGGAIGGAVNVVNQSIPSQVPDHLISGAMELRSDSGSDGQTGVIRLDGGQDSIAWHLDVVHRDMEDYQTPLGTLPNSFVTSRAANAGFAIFGDQGSIGLSISDSDSLYGLPLTLQGDTDAEVVQLDLEQTRLNLKANWLAPIKVLHQLIASASTNDYQHVELEGDEVGTVFSNDEIESRLEASLSPLADWQSAIGIQVRTREFTAVGEEAFIPPSSTRSQGLFVLADRALQQWTLELGGRVDSTEVQALGRLQDFDTLSLSGGAVVPLNDRLTFKAYLSHAERAPVVEELYSDGLHVATASIELGDDSLIKETSQNLDVSLHRHGELWSYTVSAYLNQFDDFIYQRNTAEALIDDGEVVPVRQWTQADATLKGMEFETNLHLLTRPSGDLDVNFWGDWVDAELRSGENLPRIAPARLAAGLAWDAQRWHLGLDVIRTFEQDQVAHDEETTSGYSMVNLNAMVRLGQGLQDWELFARVRNATDETARNHTSFLRDRAPLPGRNATVGIRFRF